MWKWDLPVCCWAEVNNNLCFQHILSLVSVWRCVCVHVSEGSKNGIEILTVNTNSMEQWVRTEQ